MYLYNDWAVVVPMANEEEEFKEFSSSLASVFNALSSGVAYFVIDNVSEDSTLELATNLAAGDPRFKVIFAPENRNVVDAYLRGFREAFENGHEIIIEMDAGMSHDPRALPMFLRVLNEGNECAFGSRFINGGSMGDSPLNRRLLSKYSTILANVLLGTGLKDMTSGYQGFHREVVGKFLHHKFRATGHFYQTEVRYLLRDSRFFEVPIHYQAPSPSVSKSSISNSLQTLMYYFSNRLKGNSSNLIGS